MYYLASEPVDADKYGQKGLTSEDFAKQESFEGFDFENTWVMSAAGRPLLRNNKEEVFPKPQIPADIPVTAEIGTDETLNLAQYLVDAAGSSLTDQFENYEITEGADYASLSGTTLTFNTDTAGEHTIKVKGTYKYKSDADDPDNAQGKLDPLGGDANDVEFNITLTVNKTIPAPEPEFTEFGYSPYTSLGSIGLNDGWQWDDAAKVPATGANQKFKVIYPVEAANKDYYLYTSTTGGGYDSANSCYYDYVTLTVTESDDTPYTVNFTVKNADDPTKTIDGATVISENSYDFPDGNETANGGKLTAEMAAGLHTIYAYKSGYQIYQKTIQTYKSNGQSFTIELVPERAKVKLPTIYDSDGNKVDTEATVIKLDADTNPAHAWNGDSTTAGYKGGDTEELPTGTYEVDLSAYGYDDQTLYIVVDDSGETKYYTEYDSATGKVKESSLITEEQLKERLSAEKIPAAEYDIKLTNDTEANTVTATIKLANARKVTSGTVGIRYEPSYFTFTPFDAEDEEELVDITMGSNIVLSGTTETEYANAKRQGADIPAWTSDNGYFVFRWSYGADDGDTETLAKELSSDENGALIATLTFRVKNPETFDWDDVTSDDFGIMPWTSTNEAIAYKAWYDEENADNPEAAGDYGFEGYWRETDIENNASSLGVGRIDSKRAVVNGIDTHGFYQLTVNDSLGSESLASHYDAAVEWEMFETNNTALKFTVADSISGELLQGATVTLYPKDGGAVQREYTNTIGVAKFLVDTTAENDVTYTYTVTKPGYWPIPEEGDNPEVVVVPHVAKNVDVPLVKKVYHVPEIKGVKEGNSGDAEEGIQVTGDRDLGGERYGYNGREFHFRAQAKPGYRIKEYPTEAYITIGEVGEEGYVSTTVPVDAERMFTLDAEYLCQAALSPDKLYELYGTAEGKSSAADYSPQPDVEGYRSYNIEITFDKFSIVEDALEVRGIAGANGTVKYNADNPEGSKAATEVTADHEYVVENIIPGKDNDRTGTFEFAADTANGYMVEKVFINGIQVHDYDGEDSFDYSFGKPTMDCAIVVTFWDGETPSTDSIITLVVGDYGEVDVTAPETKKEEAVRLTRRVYMGLTEPLAITTKPDIGYELFAVETQLDDGARVAEDLSGYTEEELKNPATQTFSFAPEAGKNKTVYVTFKHPDADKTPNVFVKSYVERGDGTIDPFGLLIYNVYDTVKLNLAASTAPGKDWDARAVKVSPYGEPDKGEEIEFANIAKTNTYVINKIMESCEVGAIFEEHRYLIKGTVDLSQGKELSLWGDNYGVLTGAVVTFTRDDGLTFMTDTTAERKDAAFGIEIPVGTWTVKVSKQGYVNYIITNYVFDATGDQEDGAFKFSDKTVTPVIGSTVDGTSIKVIDIGGIRSGLRENINAAAKAKADVDNNGILNTTDMAFVLANFGARTTYKPFETFNTTP